MSDLSNTNALQADNAAKTRTYRGWSIDYDPKPIPVRNCDWTATHPDYDASYEGPEDGWVGSHPVLYAATEKDLMVEIDCWHMDEDDEDIAAIEKAAKALRSLAKRHGLTYASIDFHDAAHGEFWSAKGHIGRLARSANGRTIAKAIPEMLAREPFDTSTVEKAA